MEGFTEGIPFSVAVTWLKSSAGVYTEVPLLNAKPFPYGLLAETYNSGSAVTTRWFVPWSSVVYIKQDQPAPPAGVDPTTPVAPAAKPADPGAKKVR